MNTSTTIYAGVLAASAADAISKVERHAERASVRPTGRVVERSPRHGLYDVEIEVLGDRNEAWVVLTSYGISPSKDLDAFWQKVEGVGA